MTGEQSIAEVADRVDLDAALGGDSASDDDVIMPDPDPRTEAEALDSDDDLGEQVEEESSSKTLAEEVVDVLKRRPERHHREADLSRLWDPEEGGINRIVLFIEELVGERPPFWAQIALGGAEEWKSATSAATTTSDADGASAREDESELPEKFRRFTQ